MKRLGLTLALLLVAVPAFPQSGLGTRANDTLKRMFTQGGHFGFPPYAADPFTCTAQTRRATYYNTTSDTTLVCNGSAWTALGASLPVADTTAIVKGSADDTKLLRIEVDGFTTGTTRVLTPPNRDGTLFASGGNLDLNFNTASTHITNAFGATVVEFSNSGLLTMAGGNSGDVAVRTNTMLGPTRAYYRHAAKALTDAAATTFVQVGVPADSTTSLHIDYSVEAENATDQQVVTGTAHIGIINDAGVETCSAVTEVGEVSVTSVGTITATITCVTTPTNAVDLQMTSDTSLNVSPALTWSIRKNGGTGAITPQ